MRTKKTLLRIHLKSVFSVFYSVLYLRHETQGVAAVFQFNEPRAFQSRLIRRMKRQDQIAAGAKEHAVAAVLGNEGRQMFKTAHDTAVFRPRNALRICMLYKSGPNHQETSVC